jgi:hypothetical protein
MMPAITIELRNHDGTPQRTIGAEATWFTPPKLLVDGDRYYLRVSPANVYDPLVFDEMNGITEIYTVRE